MKSMRWNDEVENEYAAPAHFFQFLIAFFLPVLDIPIAGDVLLM